MYIHMALKDMYDKVCDGTLRQQRYLVNDFLAGEDIKEPKFYFYAVPGNLASHSSHVDIN